MRQLTQLTDERLAQRLSDLLFGRGIDNRIEPTDGGFRLWVYAEDQVAAARQTLDELEAEPQSPQLTELIEKGRQLRQQALAQRRKPDRHRQVDVRTTWSDSQRRYGQLTLAIIAICVGVYVLTEQGDRRDLVNYLLIGTIQEAVAGQPLATVWSGEVWRLVTPIFLHFSTLHIFFNMWWLLDLGSMIERRQGTLFLAGFVGLTGAFSNVAQYLVAGSPVFGGMSGVVYALLGYIWLRGRYDPGSGYFLPTYIVMFMLVWLMLGFVGLIGGLANTAHAGGLVAGAAWGGIAALRRRHRR